MFQILKEVPKIIVAKGRGVSLFNVKLVLNNPHIGQEIQLSEGNFYCQNII